MGSGRFRNGRLASGLRRAVALPIYAVALVLDIAAAVLNRIAAWIASDAWPR